MNQCTHKRRVCQDMGMFEQLLESLANEFPRLQTLDIREAEAGSQWATVELLKSRIPHCEIHANLDSESDTDSDLD